MAIRVAVGEDNLLVREGLAELLGGEPDVELVAAAADLPSLQRAIDEQRPDVVLTDIRMPPASTDDGIQLAARLRETHPEIGVVVLSQHSDPAYALGLLENGSDGRAYLLKDRVSNRAELMAAIRAVAAGSSMIDPKMVEALVVSRTQGERSPLNQLTTRELEVLREIAQGKSNAAIGDSLFLTKRAVEKHINSIFMKLRLHDSQDVSKRVKATLILLAEEGGAQPPE
jgi:DNA-binding NarL/FixJ family response regulator